MYQRCRGPTVFKRRKYELIFSWQDVNWQVQNQLVSSTVSRVSYIQPPITRRDEIGSGKMKKRVSFVEGVNELCM
jgi:hypothetical protein